ncbi:MAG: Txe/YoeB family addiction module toxin [Bacteroidales bacterium]|uniref:Txe/YoeB family addiction module toxin n=1 Tax=Candidatus Cryptobacteroides sp. TaxID=2952915 RepID=UPI002A764F5E|nr:Txe/YoeB family addiction module toxin [Candidatus Cryptobacteroides sp.]MDD7234011.1 Txe/YoeB family addiction module toxin [Bacteroidales bacterium]MDY2702110.1 Txe/YoeB family addiction module toxin [Candidatus Cryptobacteroides sp.]
MLIFSTLQFGSRFYRIVFSNDAKKDLKELSKKAPLAIKKLSKLLEEIQEHPRTGTGQVEPLKGYDGDVYSRRITHEHRLVYRIYDEVIEVLVLSAFGHYKK